MRRAVVLRTEPLVSFAPAYMRSLKLP